MAIFKCKMCGGTLEVNEDDSIVECEYCGTKQTLPKLDNDRKINLYDRANHYRRNNEFDKAMGIYEQILGEDNTDAEIYWSIVLCRYGIEYVEDPSTHKRIPTVNRMQFASIKTDEDYKEAINHADILQKTIYEEEAEVIDNIQKNILEISSKEDPFDLFICYKETDNVGNRTVDSVLAYDLYNELTKEGYKVFFSRITLEDKIGTAYEPYIFAALNSAKIMIVLGTKPEYFNATWVKNEWSRYLTLVKKSNGKKILIPAYKDMDPYDLPEEFSYLQAQDMSKLGFMQDLLRGIKKILDEETSAKKAKKTSEAIDKDLAILAGPKTDPLLERVFMFLEDEEWEKAEEYCEKVLDKNPKCAKAYLGKFMAEKKVKYICYLDSKPVDKFLSKNFEIQLKGLEQCQNLTQIEAEGSDDFESDLVKFIESYRDYFDNDNFEKAIRYADDELRQQLEEYQKRKELWVEEALIQRGKYVEKYQKRRKERIEKFEREEKECGIKLEFDSMSTTYSKQQEFAEKYEKMKDNFYKNIAQEFREKTAENIKKRKKLEDFISLKNEGKNIENLKALENQWNFIETNIKNHEHNINTFVGEISNLTAQKSSLGFLAIRKKQEIDNKIILLRNQIKKEKGLLSSLQAQKHNYNSLEEVQTKIENYQKLVLENVDNDGKYSIDKTDEIVFGEFEGFPIVWKVVSKEKNRLSLFCERSLCCKPYDKFGSEDYVNSSLRKWLNTEFYNNAFSKTEKTIIKKSNRQIIQISRDINSKEVTQKQEIQDYVSLLYIEDAYKMYGQREYLYLLDYKKYSQRGYWHPDAFWVINPRVNLRYENENLITQNGGQRYGKQCCKDPVLEASVHPFIEITL